MRKYSTQQFAESAFVKPQTIRAAYCRQGHYLTVKPIKLPNRKLAWPADAVDSILTGELHNRIEPFSTDDK